MKHKNLHNVKQTLGLTKKEGGQLLSAYIFSLIHLDMYILSLRLILSPSPVPPVKL